MNIYCIHCGEKFSITKEQLGKRGKCPHCKSTVVMPKSRLQYGHKERQIDPPSRWMESSLSGISAVVLHLMLLVLLALMPWGNFSTGEGGEGDQIMIGHLAREQLIDTPNDKLQSVEVQNPIESNSAELLENEFDSPTALNALAQSELDLSMGAIRGGARNALQIESANQSSILAGGSESFGKMLTKLKKDGLDIVIVFDSTGSMQGEINEVKKRIGRIGKALQKLIPEKTRIGICTYRDQGDEFIVKGLRLTEDIGAVSGYLSSINAKGGGDLPEAVDEGLAWAIRNNQFRRSARKVILLFGDAPPHAGRIESCQKLASEFRNKHRGIVSTVTCRSEESLESFDSIAKLGGGESFLTRDQREIMKQLMVLVFGSQHRSKVLEAFNLMDIEN
jgi:DNA-directed RNA polymerase subunit RPC12/RpoP